MIDYQETQKKFGYDLTGYKHSERLCISICEDCGAKRTVKHFVAMKSLRCQSCAVKRRFKQGEQLNKGLLKYERTDEWRRKQSEAKKAAWESGKYGPKQLAILNKQHQPKLSKQDLEKIKQLICKEGWSCRSLEDKLKVSHTTIARALRLKLGFHSPRNSSGQANVIYNLLTKIFGAGGIKREVREQNFRFDFFVPSIGRYIEYDGGRFWHHKSTSIALDDKKDQGYTPVRLDGQAYLGGEAYLRWRLLQQHSGYTAVSSPKKYTIKEIKSNVSSRFLNLCHVLGTSAGHRRFGLFHEELLIGVCVFGRPTNRYKTDQIELRRFCILDGTPRNTESWFLNRCMRAMPAGQYVTYCHAAERGSYLRACGWKLNDRKSVSYDVYIINGKEYSRRTVWYWAKKAGLIASLGTTHAKEVLVNALGGTKVTQPSKLLFTFSKDT